MNESTNPYLQAIFKKYGPRWDPSFLIDQEPNKDTPAKFAVQISAHANEVLRKVTRDFPGFDVNLFFVENADINAFAGKVSDTHEHYAVGVFSGTIVKLFEVFNSRSYLEVLRRNLKVIGYRSDLELQQFSLYFSTLFLIYHEFGHVVRGHINYGKSLSEADVLLMEGYEAAGIPTPQDIERRHLCECDADASAGTLLGGQAYEHARKWSAELRLPSGAVMRDLTALITTATHLLFCIFDNARRIVHPFYPPPPLRSAIVLSHVAAYAVHHGQHSDQLLHDIVAALNRVEGLRRQLGLKQGAYDLGKAFESWSTTYLERLKQFKETLKPYAPDMHPSPK